MTDSSPSATGSMRSAHPLAVELCTRLAANPKSRILEIGCGRGRNTRALAAAGFEVRSLPDGAPILPSYRNYTAALSTHALLHGTPDTLAVLLAAVRAALCRGGLLYATFGSISDARHGRGIALAPGVFAPSEGAERGVPHSYFDEARLRTLLSPSFAVESLSEHCVERIAGDWAHPQGHPGAVHWFVIARSRGL
ncbi:MAG: class I SAM-dependent methyltransferase [Vulcanimicrobiaceae bacterium]